jgi:hypothetical protein
MAETTLDGQVAFTVVSDLRGDERLLSAALTELPKRVLAFAKKKRISRGKDWSGLDKLVLIGNTPGHQLDDKSWTKFYPAWGYLEDSLSKLKRMGAFESGRAPSTLKDYGPAALASWFAEHGRQSIDIQAAKDFLTYVGYRDWKTGNWDPSKDGLVTQNYRKFWRYVAKAIAKVPFHVRVMPTDRVYFEEVPAQYDLSWDARKVGNLSFRSMPVGKIQNRHFVHALAAGPHDRAGIPYDYRMFTPQDADVTFGYLFPPELDELLKADAAHRAEHQLMPRERLLVFTYNLLEKNDLRQNRARAHPGTVIVEEVQNTVSTYVFHGRQAWRIQHKWDPGKAAFVEDIEEPLKFSKPQQLTPTSLSPAMTEEAAALQLLSLPERFKMFIDELRNLDPAAADDLKDKQVTTFEALARLQSGYVNKVNEQGLKLVEAHTSLETFCNKIFEALGCPDLYANIKAAVWEKYHIQSGKELPEAAHAELSKEAASAALQRITHAVQAIGREKTASLNLLGRLGADLHLGTAYEDIVAQARSKYALAPEATLTPEAGSWVKDELAKKIVSQHEHHVGLLKKALEELEKKKSETQVLQTEQVAWVEERKQVDKILVDAGERFGVRIHGPSLPEGVGQLVNYILDLKAKVSASDSQCIEANATIGRKQEALDALKKEKDAALEALSKELAEKKELIERLNKDLKFYEKQLLGESDEATQRVIDERAREFARGRIEALERSIKDLEEQNAGLVRQRDTADNAYRELAAHKSVEVEGAKKSETQYKLMAQNAYGEARKEFEGQLADRDRRIGELESILQSQDENHQKAVALTKVAERLCAKKPAEAAALYKKAYELAPHAATKSDVAFNVGFALYRLAEKGNPGAYAEAIPWFEKSVQDDETKEFLAYCRSKGAQRPGGQQWKIVTTNQ